MQRHRRMPLLLLVAATVTLAACGSDAVDGEPSSTSTTVPAPTEPLPESTTSSSTPATTVATIPERERPTMATPASSERLLDATDIALTSVLLTVPNAGHVAMPVAQCAARIEFAFLADTVLPDGGSCLDQPVPE